MPTPQSPLDPEFTHNPKRKNFAKRRRRRPRFFEEGLAGCLLAPFRLLFWAGILLIEALSALMS
ncbi:MAG: hypothetical protein AAGM22_11630 [Acidobacteriota bacterium]